jgi:hypothetical protein
MRGRSWEPGEAIIVEKHIMHVSGRLLTVSAGNLDDLTRFKFVLDVEVPGKTPFRTTLKSPSWRPEKFMAPSPGQVVWVKADVERQKAKWDRSPEANAAGLQDNLARRQAATPEPSPPTGPPSRTAPPR